jgi:DNA-binding NarL/FixJ family response regulator
MKTITVLLCDDHTIIREGLRILLESAGDIEVVGQAQDGRQAVQESERLRPNLVLVDLGMPLLNGVEATGQITRRTPSSKVLILSSYSDEQHVQEAIAAGASGYLIKETAGQELLRAIREIHLGNVFFSPAVSMVLLKLRRASFRPDPLTSREREVIQLIAEGYATKQIADVLSITPKTADKHRQTLMDNLGIHKVAGLTRYAIANGFVESNRVPNCPPIWPIIYGTASLDEPECAFIENASITNFEPTKQTKERNMSKTSVNKGKALKVLGLLLSLGALPLVCGVTGCAGDRYTQSTGEHLDDRTTSSRVKKALDADPQYKYDGVDVKTFKATVQLSGFVNTKEQKDRAGELARAVDGVKEVENNITVKQ